VRALLKNQSIAAKKVSCNFRSVENWPEIAKLKNKLSGLFLLLYAQQMMRSIPDSS
jgi:hypothetical protein